MGSLEVFLTFPVGVSTAAREAALGSMTLNGVSLAVQMEVLADVVAGRMP